MEGGGARNRSDSGVGGVGSSISFIRSLVMQSYRDNRHNLERSGTPSRALYYYINSATPENESSSSSTDESGWNDFPDQSMLDIFRSIVMMSRIPRRRVVVDGRVCAVDLERMLLVYSAGSIGDLSVRSVAWMDVDGRCFFPARHIAHGSLARRPFIQQVSLIPDNHPLMRRLRPLPRTALPDLNEPPPPPPPPPPDIRWQRER